MPGLVPGIHVLRASWPDVDGRDKPGHDAAEAFARSPRAPIRDSRARTPGDYRPGWLTFH
ncbi:hypothetical protein B5V03_05685 [Bradyrhizobium betae]|uniref:Uncharacterized protein n=1 Tax=Bradyrhizobium betae TaxID=244734 RepID=A0A4Q1VIT8_9BRAD|nr:hypothetical protein B5V03_05685 [Bradyrhizobium betae]